MKQRFLIAFTCSAILFCAGCKNDAATSSDDKSLRQSFAKKSFDINDVPPKERARVQGFIDRAKQMAAKGPSSGK